MDLGNDGGEPRDLPSSPLARSAPFNVVLAVLFAPFFLRSARQSVGERAPFLGKYKQSLKPQSLGLGASPHALTTVSSFYPPRLSGSIMARALMVASVRG
jgi:hypothetical protein